MSVLVIGDRERSQIKKLIEQQLKNPTSMERLAAAGKRDYRPTLTFEERQPGFEQPPSSHVEFPGGIRAALSFEYQPAGLCSHLSISVRKKGKMPHPEAARMICEEFGVPFPALRMWNEEYEPGRFAINLVSLWNVKE